MAIIPAGTDQILRDHQSAIERVLAFPMVVHFPFRHIKNQWRAAFATQIEADPETGHRDTVREIDIPRGPSFHFSHALAHIRSLDDTPGVIGKPGTDFFTRAQEAEGFDLVMSFEKFGKNPCPCDPIGRKAGYENTNFHEERAP